jgi:hypothetical protein
MAAFCRKLAVVGLLAVLFASAGGSALAQAVHAACAARHHGCHETVKISSCCCGEDDSSLSEVPPDHPRSEPRAVLSAQPLCPFGVCAPATRNGLSRVQTSPPRFFSIDLPILFVTFLI